MQHFLLVFAAAVAALTLSITCEAEDMSDYDAIKTTIYDYFEGLKTQDRARLEKAFAVDAGHMKGYLKNDAGGYDLSVRPMSEVIDDWVSRDPMGEMEGQLVDVNIYSDVAATALFDFNGVFIDAFNLAKIGGQWKIVNKFYINK
ncbi:MAG: nuclear transport factor 2 family protein [Gammaproteobacteria bacterium]